MGDGGVVRVADHVGEGLAGGVADDQYGVPGLTLLGDQRGGAVADVEDLGAEAAALLGEPAAYSR